MAGVACFQKRGKRGKGEKSLGVWESIGKTHQDVDICLSVSWRAQPALRVGVGSK
jgi:hypothetical protein